MKARREKGGCVIREIERREKLENLREKIRRLLAVMATVLDQTDLEIDTNRLGVWMKEVLTPTERLEVATDFCNGRSITVGLTTEKS